MTELFQAIIFGIVEGITEWLPVSSTGHMILLNSFMPMNVSDAFMDMFLVVIQLGAIMAVVVIFWHNLWPFSFKRGTSFLRKDVWVMWFKVLVACIPAVVVELIWGDVLEDLFYNYVVVSVMLIVVGVLFIIAEVWNANRTPSMTGVAQITYRAAFIIGLFQVVAAVFPGTSRSGATILGALLIGVSRTAAAEFTFYLAVPVMFGASLIKVLEFGLSFTAAEIVILAAGMLTAYIVSMLCIRFLMGYVRRHDFKIFGWYRILLGTFVLLYFNLWV